MRQRLVDQWKKAFEGSLKDDVVAAQLISMINKDYDAVTGDIDATPAEPEDLRGLLGAVSKDWKDDEQYDVTNSQYWYLVDESYAIPKSGDELIAKGVKYIVLATKVDFLGASYTLMLRPA